MKRQEYHFEFEVYESMEELAKEDAWLLDQAREVTQNAYAPYSKFKVGAVAKLANGEIVSGTNQENASYPVGICAERVLLSVVSSLFPKQPIDTMAISYNNANGESDQPITPCGICRQSIKEFEQRMNQPVRLILGGMHGKVYVIPNADNLLPLSFTGEDLKR
ncbi:MAG: cytidine deaminase [Sphingobacteriales bacterium]|nr:cytidine deaminase [Sphingobacteriales bacterium]